VRTTCRWRDNLRLIRRYFVGDEEKILLLGSMRSSIINIDSFCSFERSSSDYSKSACAKMAVPRVSLLLLTAASMPKVSLNVRKINRLNN
jgi:hypothetical protein